MRIIGELIISILCIGLLRVSISNMIDNYKLNFINTFNLRSFNVSFSDKLDFIGLTLIDIFLILLVLSLWSATLAFIFNIGGI